MNVIKTKLPGVLLIEPKRFDDARGYFYECFQGQRYAEHGMPDRFVQDNFSRSQQGVLRGLHYQLHHAQGKLVWVTQGRVFDVAVDLRRDSPTFGQHERFLLTADVPRQLYIPPGFAHGFYVIEGPADFYYKCTDYYNPQAERGIRWDDPDLAIDWSCIDAPVLSGKDQSYPCLKDIPQAELPNNIFYGE